VMVPGLELAMKAPGLLEMPWPAEFDIVMVPSLKMVSVLKMPPSVSDIVMVPDMLLMVPSLMMPWPAGLFDIVMVPVAELLMVPLERLSMPILLTAEF